MNLNGNLVQIPNSTVYKSIICNFTANPNRRESFVVGIGYDDDIAEAQGIARRVLGGHPAVLKEPEPWVLVDSMGSAIINLRIYFWLNGHEHSFLKVRSSVIRLIKHALQEAGISMPDEAREVVFPKGIPVTLLSEKSEERRHSFPTKQPPAGRGKQSLQISTEAEDGLHSDARMIEEQAQHIAPLNNDENLLKDAPPSLAR
jgi:small-conductance mechanosensitive channel